MNKKFFGFFLLIISIFFVFQAGRLIYYTSRAIMMITHVEAEEGILEEKVTYDGAYKMVVELEEASDLHYINIRIVDEKTKEEVYWIDHVYRAWDFQWITWEKESYHFWIKSGDLGTFCYEYTGNGWEKAGITRYLEKYGEGSVTEVRLEEINKKLPDEYRVEYP
ncbi:MAG: hypothetical protein IJP31_07825 [Lachnospiraceae bacterium]|nr:hypothetical protein [Lachnospiraceae bacterium]